MPRLLLVLAILLLSLTPVWAAPGISLELNAGKRWKVKPEMMVHLRAMEKELQEYSSASASRKQQLPRSLKTNLEKLTASCTMSGPAHDQLHNWLVPYMETINALAGEKNAAKRSEMVEKLLNSYTVFHTYFE